MRTVWKIFSRLLFAGVLVLAAAAIWVRFSTAGYLYADPAVVPSRQVALVLGASVFRSGKPSPVVEARLRAAVRLLDAGKVKKILVSGDHKPDDYDEAEAMRTWLLHAGVPSAQIAVDYGGLRTLESVVRAQSKFDARSVVVCTQAFHLPRAVFLARRAGIDAVGLKVGGDLVDTGYYDLSRESLATVRAVVDAQFLTAQAALPAPGNSGPAPERAPVAAAEVAAPPPAGLPPAVPVAPAVAAGAGAPPPPATPSAVAANKRAVAGARSKPARRPTVKAARAARSKARRARLRRANAPTTARR